MTNRCTSANTTTAELAADYFDQPDRIATIGRIHRRLCLASRAQRLHGIHALTKEFRDLGPVPIARRKVIAALGGTAAAHEMPERRQPGRPAKPRRPTQGAGRESGGAPRLQRRRRDPLRGAELAVTRGRAAKSTEEYLAAAASS
jgi:hypothetical protein